MSPFVRSEHYAYKYKIGDLTDCLDDADFLGFNDDSDSGVIVSGVGSDGGPDDLSGFDVGVKSDDYDGFGF